MRNRERLPVSLVPVACAVLLGLVAGCASGPGAPPSAGADPSALTLERVLASPSLSGTAPRAPAWSPDSRRLAFLWNDAGRAQREIWLVESDGSELRRLTTAPQGMEGSGVRELCWSPSSDTLFFLRGGDLWRTDLTGEARRLDRGAGARSELRLSPDGRTLSFLEGGDLWLADADEGAPRRATRVGVPSLSKVPLGRYRRPEVELGSYVWGGPTYAWSPDGRHIAVHHVDRTHLRVVHFPHYLGEDTDPNPVRRSYPGDANEARRVGILTLGGAEHPTLELLELENPTDVRVVGFSWSPRGTLLIDRESDTAVDRWLHVYDPEERELKQLWHDARETRVYNAVASDWHPNGEDVLLLSDLGERYGFWQLGAEGSRPRWVTPQEFDVTGGPYLAAEAGAVFYQANDPSPAERHAFRWAADAAPVRLTERPGHHVPFPSPDGTRVALLSSADGEPTELWLTDGTRPAPAQRVTHSPPEEFARRPWARARYVSFPSHSDGVRLHARILEPRELVPGKRYPVLFGPVYSNTVRNRWNGRWALIQQLLVERGYVVVQVDVRGSTGYGRGFREDFLMDFAGEDLEDLESAVSFLKTLPYVDPERFGIWGSSYGGTLTVYSLLKKPGLFRAGVACASAVDPFFFGGDDVAIVRTPETHPEVFARGAAQYADRLEDELLLIHGLQDQVVPFKTVADLSEALMRAGKDFDFAFAPTATHGWAAQRHHARYLFGKLLAHFDRHL